MCAHHSGRFCEINLFVHLMEENINLLDYVGPMNWKFIGVTNGEVQTANKWVDGNYSKNTLIMVDIINIHHNFYKF